MAGLVAYGRDIATQATTGLSAAADMERGREVANQQMEAAHEQALVSNTLSGAMAGGMLGGAMLGASMGAAAGPVGMAAGALIGYAVTELF